MCGICGLFDKASRAVDKDIIIRMRDVMAKRGPNDHGCYVAPHIGLGHRRLSVTDLSPAGRQPMSNEDGTIWVVHNGEIYNFPELRDRLIEKGHRFSSHTDTEVLIHGYEEWGLEELLKKVNGMYAFGIWDSRKKELILVRDRLGVKPLYYMETDGKVYFASDMKSIWLAYDKDLQVNYKAIDHFLCSSCIPQEYSIFEGIRKLHPGHFIRFSKSETFCSDYWYLSFAEKEKMSEREFIEQIKAKLLVAVKRRMQSDVPSGAFLSGGVDSSLVVALMAQLSDLPIKTFSMGVKEELYSELKYATMVANRYGTEHHELMVEPQAVSILPSLVWAYGEPFADPSQIPTFYISQFAKQHVTVVLSGDGGDESFGGYSNIAAHYFGSLYRKYLPPLLASRYLPSLVDSVALKIGRKGAISKLKTLTDYGSRTFSETYKISGSFNQRQQLLTDEFIGRLGCHDPADVFEKYILSADGSNEVDKALYVDIKTILPNDYLTKVDVASMMNSLEVRSPFLDYEVMELAAKIPSHIKLRNGIQKYLLKRIASDFVPHDAVYRRKKGFTVPMGLWFKNDLGGLLKRVLLSDSLSKRNYFSTSYIRFILDEHVSGKSDHTRRLWALLCLELWHLIFIDRTLRAEDFQ